jgi:hypothetical protein
MQHNASYKQAQIYYYTNVASSGLRKAQNPSI